MSVYSAEQLGELANKLGGVADWLRDKCTARHNEDMADLVDEAVSVIDDLYDEQLAAEAS